MWDKISLYARRYPARISGYLSGLVLYLNKWVPYHLLDAVIVPSIMILIGLGEISQRAEDKKTIKALYLEPDPKIPDQEEIEKICKK